MWNADSSAVACFNKDDWLMGHVTTAMMNLHVLVLLCITSCVVVVDCRTASSCHPALLLLPIDDNDPKMGTNASVCGVTQEGWLPPVNKPDIGDPTESSQAWRCLFTWPLCLLTTMFTRPLTCYQMPVHLIWIKWIANQTVPVLVDGHLNVAKLESRQKMSFPVECHVNLDPHIKFCNQSALLVARPTEPDTPLVLQSRDALTCTKQSICHL